jgi:hypothetical protein
VVILLLDTSSVHCCRRIGETRCLLSTLMMEQHVPPKRQQHYPLPTPECDEDVYGAQSLHTRSITEMLK